MRRRSVFSALATSAALVLTLASATMGAAPHRTVAILDNCDGPTFNAGLGFPACNRPSGMSFQTFGEMLAKGGAPSWRFSPGRVTLEDGGSVTAINRGGEFHTFSQVAQFGGGCEPTLNAALGLSPVAECSIPGYFFSTGVPQGATRTVGPLDSGTYNFQCLIHPWQRTTVTAR